ncbi:MAG: tetratricopeptide repeat protein [Candidatus Tenebribacter davisii]|nr:tetratricopeptide repeat protein [Candidatus Tenebribacter davisii]
MSESYQNSEGHSVRIMQRTLKDLLLYNLYWRETIQLIEVIIAIPLCIIGSLYGIDSLVIIGLFLFMWAVLIGRFLRPILKRFFSAANHNKLGNFFFDSGLIDDAIAQFSTAISLSPKAGVCYINRAQCYGMKQAYEKAIDDAKTAILIDEPFPYAHYILGLIYDDIGNWKKAWKEFNEAIKLTEKLKTLGPKTDEVKKLQYGVSWKIAPVELMKKDVERYKIYNEIRIDTLTRLSEWHSVPEEMAVEKLLQVLSTSEQLIYGKLSKTKHALSDGNFLEFALDDLKTLPEKILQLLEKKGHKKYTEEVNSQFQRGGESAFMEVTHVGTLKNSTEILVLRAISAKGTSELMLTISRIHFDYLFSRYYSIYDSSIIFLQDGLNSVVFWIRGDFYGFLRPTKIIRVTTSDR